MDAKHWNGSDERDGFEAEARCESCGKPCSEFFSWCEDCETEWADDIERQDAATYDTENVADDYRDEEN